jgi:HEAT repeat protein
MENRDDDIGYIEDGWDLWWDVQLAAVKSLGKLRAESAVEPLERLMHSVEGEDIEPNILTSLAEIGTESSVEILAKILNDSSDPRKQRRAATALGDVNSDAAKQAIAILGRALRDNHKDVRVHVIQALQQQDAKRYLPAIALLIKDSSDEVRSAAAAAVTTLGEMKKPTQESIDLFSNLLNDESALVRSTSLNTLANLETAVLRDKLSDESVERTIELIGDRDIESSIAATRLFSKLNRNGAERQLIELLDDDSRENAIRRQAALSLSMVETVGEDSVAALTQTLSDPEQSIRHAALISLMGCEERYSATDNANRSPRPIEVIIDALHGEIDLEREDVKNGDEPNSTETDSEVKTQSQNVSFNKDHNSTPEQDTPLPESHPVDDEEIRESTSTLDAIAMDNVESALRFHEDENSEDEIEIEHDDETREFLGILDTNRDNADRRDHRFKNKDITTDIRRLAASTLGRYQSALAIDELRLALSDEDHELRRLAAEALAEIARKDPANSKLHSVIGTLISQLQFSDGDTRMASIRALGAMENRSAIPTLLEHLNDEETIVRMEAIKALVTVATSKLDSITEGHMVTHEINNAEILSRISNALEDEQPSVRTFAADGITTLLQHNSKSESPDHNQAGSDNSSEDMIQKIIDAGFAGAGAQARHMGRALRIVDSTISTKHLIPLLNSIDSSAGRRFVIEMLEEIYQDA